MLLILLPCSFCFFQREEVATLQSHYTTSYTMTSINRRAITGICYATVPLPPLGISNQPSWVQVVGYYTTSSLLFSHPTRDLGTDRTTDREIHSPPSLPYIPLHLYLRLSTHLYLSISLQISLSLLEL